MYAFHWMGCCYNDLIVLHNTFIMYRLTCDLEMSWQMMSSLYLDMTFMALWLHRLEAEWFFY